ncbi:hypothetical protein GHT07_11005 [Caenimonas koreensis DSM 17982]|uniref:Uncharacterized protein n=1 Tax=Caenimonas koreensis DSM 17982 TaxID=1121255 RepID=A0A844AZG7_9BURK|nr:hypothetical protein [Caenimonas koreensis]MRD47808.1 hypothetical protein [Caenimonas koreensis DSM 17982]
MTPKTTPPQPEHKPVHESGDDAGTNAVEHEPDPGAQPLPDGHHKYMPKSPFTAGNS